MTSFKAYLLFPDANYDKPLRSCLRQYKGTEELKLNKSILYTIYHLEIMLLGRKYGLNRITIVFVVKILSNCIYKFKLFRCLSQKCYGNDL